MLNIPHSTQGVARGQWKACSDLDSGRIDNLVHFAAAGPHMPSLSHGVSEGVGPDDIL